MINEFNQLEAHLLNDYQRDFPLVAEPFSQMAGELGSSSATVISSLKKLKQQGAVSRVGPVFRPNRVGVSTLAAVSAPTGELEQVAEIINRYPEVNHNYEREHTYNLWFVATAKDQVHLQAVLDDIEKTVGCRVISLPLVREYHIDLGFNMGHFVSPYPNLPLQGGKEQEDDQEVTTTGSVLLPSPLAGEGGAAKLERESIACDDTLIEAIQSGLPLVERPYFAIGERLGLEEKEVIQRITHMQMEGVIKRLGVVVRHRELGYRANAMLVWDVPDSLVDEVGQRLSTADCVTLCYQRPRVLPDWPYNLFTMIHGKDRDDVLACIEDIAEKLELTHLPRQALFSRRRFKQRGARYRGH